MIRSQTKNGAATRGNILAAARRRFAAENYEAVGLRDVAREAGIDVALVSRYFGSKEELFQKVLLERADQEWFGGNSELDGISDWLADLAAGSEGDRDDLERLSIILRSASSLITAKIVRNAFVDDVFAPLTRLLGEQDGEERAKIALSIVIGATLLRGILDVAPPTSKSREKERDRLRFLIRGALSDAPPTSPDV